MTIIIHAVNISGGGACFVQDGMRASYIATAILPSSESYFICFFPPGQTCGILDREKLLSCSSLSGSGGGARGLWLVGQIRNQKKTKIIFIKVSILAELCRQSWSGGLTANKE